MLGVEVGLRELFARPVLAEFALAVRRERRGAGCRRCAAGERGERLPLSFAQQRLWFLAQMEGVSEAYHVPLGLRLRGRVGRGGAAPGAGPAWWRGMRRCGPRFAVVDGEPVQRIAAAKRAVCAAGA